MLIAIRASNLNFGIIGQVAEIVVPVNAIYFGIILKFRSLCKIRIVYYGIKGIFKFRTAGFEATSVCCLSPEKMGL